MQSAFGCTKMPLVCMGHVPRPCPPTFATRSAECLFSIPFVFPWPRRDMLLSGRVSQPKSGKEGDRTHGVYVTQIFQRHLVQFRPCNLQAWACGPVWFSVSLYLRVRECKCVVTRSKIPTKLSSRFYTGQGKGQSAATIVNLCILKLSVLLMSFHLQN